MKKLSIRANHICVMSERAFFFFFVLVDTLGRGLCGGKLTEGNVSDLNHLSETQVFSAT